MVSICPVRHTSRGLNPWVWQNCGFGSHTYSFINAQGERFWVKFHFKSLQGITYYTDQEGAELVGQNRESAQADLFQNIADGNFPRWRFCVQVMPEKDADTYHLNPFGRQHRPPHGQRAQEIQLRQICHFFRADLAYGAGVAQALGLDLSGFVNQQ